MRTLVALVVALALIGCSETDVDVTSPTSPSDPPGATTRIEYRVNGNATGARVKYVNAIDGLTQVVTSLPYIAVIRTTESSMFLTLEATPIAYSFNVIFPFMSVQIFVDGQLFREASSSDFILSPVVVSGTWRK